MWYSHDICYMYLPAHTHSESDAAPTNGRKTTSEASYALNSHQTAHQPMPSTSCLAGCCCTWHAPARTRMHHHSHTHLLHEEQGGGIRVLPPPMHHAALCSPSMLRSSHNAQHTYCHAATTRHATSCQRHSLQPWQPTTRQQKLGAPVLPVVLPPNVNLNVAGHQPMHQKRAMVGTRPV